jgi:hypothetical protein
MNRPAKKFGQAMRAPIALDARMRIGIRSRSAGSCRIGAEMSLYTKDGRPLQEVGDYVYSRSGAVVGKRRGDKVFGPNGRYVGTIAGDRLVYRSTDSAGISSSFSVARRSGSARAHSARSAVWGDEPDIPD